MITLENKELVFRFDESHPDAVCRIGFQRTLRIPDDDRQYPLPAGLGLFDLRHIDDFAEKLPHTLARRGGVIMPMWQAEAMWLNFSRRYTQKRQYPFAIKIAAGKVNAITGEPWRDGLHTDPQDYLVVPTQPWLDGFCVKKGTIRQFVATALGQGATVEEQITGQAKNGGIQITAFPMKRDVYDRLYPDRHRADFEYSIRGCIASSPLDMGFAAGGQMRQEVYADPYGLDAWDVTHSSRCFVTVLNAPSWHSITGSNPPTQPPSTSDYKKIGLPWFDYYAADQKPLEGSNILARVKSFANFGTSSVKPGTAHVSEPDEFNINSIGPNKRPVGVTNQVREGSF
jgi:hypothetical protein